MNELIEQLYKQSFIEVQDENSFPCMSFSKQRFAELIIKECAEVINADIGYQIKDGIFSNVHGLNQARNLIKEHFGVDK